MIQSLLAASALSLPPAAYSNSYGIFDARTHAFAGTAIAIADVNQGHFYNPALLAFHEGDEDRSQDGRHYLPVSAHLSESAKTAADAIDSGLEDRLSSAVEAFNQAPSADAARFGEETALDLRQAMLDLKDTNLYADAFAGYAITQPGDREGGAFYIGSRLFGGGTSRIEDDDLALLDDYLDLMRYLYTDGSSGTQHPELYNMDGSLLDPSDEILSSAAAQVAIVTEAGVAGGKQFTFLNQVVALGITPKVVQVKLFDEQWQREADGYYRSDARITKHFFSLDVGLAMPLGEHFRVGLALKDLRHKTFHTALGNKLVFPARSRLGFAYIGTRWQVGLDADLTQSRVLYSDERRQDISLGVEWLILPNIALRSGYRKDVQDNLPDKLAFGLGWKISRFSVDVAYSKSAADLGYALQVGFSH